MTWTGDLGRGYSGAERWRWRWNVKIKYISLSVCGYTAAEMRDVLEDEN